MFSTMLFVGILQKDYEGAYKIAGNSSIYLICVVGFLQK